MIMLRVWAKIFIVLIKEITMIGAVMFLGGFFASLLAFYGRNAPLLMLAVILFAFCWVGNERIHKAFRLIPASLCLGLSAVWMFSLQSSIVLTYNYSALISALMFLLLIVSILPQKEFYRD